MELRNWAGEPTSAPALATPLSTPSAIAVDAAGRFYVNTGLMQKVYRVDPATGRALHYAGSGITDDFSAPTLGPALAVSLGYVNDLEIDAAAPGAPSKNRVSPRPMTYSTRSVGLKPSGSSFRRWSRAFVRSSAAALSR